MHNQIGPDPFHAEPDDTLIGRKIAENALGVYAIQSYIERVVAYCKLRCRALAQKHTRTRTLSITWLANDARLRNSKPSLVEDTSSTLGLYCSSSSRIEPSLFNQGTRERAQTWTLGSSWLRWRTVPTRTA